MAAQCTEDEAVNGRRRWHDGGVRRVHVEVRGQVQGVFFRASCVERARALGVGGWVRNTLDGGVEAEFEGEPDSVDAMVSDRKSTRLNSSHRL